MKKQLSIKAQQILNNIYSGKPFNSNCFLFATEKIRKEVEDNLFLIDTQNTKNYKLNKK